MVTYRIRHFGDPDFCTNLTFGNLSSNFYGIHTRKIPDLITDIPELFQSMDQWFEEQYGYRALPAPFSEVRVSRCGDIGLLWIPANSETWMEQSEKIMMYIRYRGILSQVYLRTFNIEIVSE